MTSSDFKKTTIKAIFSSTDFSVYPNQVDFETNWLGKYLDSTIKKEMTGKIKEKGRVGKFENRLEVFSDGVLMVYVKNSHGEYYPVVFDVSGETATYSYD